MNILKCLDNFETYVSGLHLKKEYMPYLRDVWFMPTCICVSMLRCMGFHVLYSAVCDHLFNIHVHIKHVKTNSVFKDNSLDSREFFVI